MEEKIEMKLRTFMDIMDSKKEYEKESDELEELLDLIFDNVRLGYKEQLVIDDSEAIMEYLKVKEKYRYNKKQAELIDKKEEGKGNV